MATTPEVGVNGESVELLMEHGIMISFDPASGAGVLVDPRGPSAIPIDVVHAGVLTVGGYSNLQVRRRDGTIGRLVPQPRLLACRLPGLPWERSPRPLRPPPEPEQSGRWVMLGEDGGLYVLDRRNATLTAIPNPLDAPDLPLGGDGSELLPGSTMVPIIWENGVRALGGDLEVTLPDHGVGDDAAAIGDHRPAADPGVESAAAQWRRSFRSEGSVNAARLADAAIFLPDNPAADYQQWGGWQPPHDHPEWADQWSLPGWMPPQPGEDA